MKLYHAFLTSIVLLLIDVLNPYLLETSKLSYFDFLQRTHTASQSSQIILVDIDEKSLQEEGQWPWSRDVLAEYIDKIPDNNLIAINILFSEKDRLGGDESLAKSISKKPTILSTQVTDNLEKKTDLHVGSVTLGPTDAPVVTKNYNGILAPIPILLNNASGYGALTSSPSIDGVVREMPLIISSDKKVYPSFALEILRVAVGDKSYQIKTNDLGIEWVRIPVYKPIQTNNDGSIYNSYWNKFKKISIMDLDTTKIEDGSIIIFGSTFAGTNIIPTPIGGMYAHEVQANMIETIIKGTTIKRPDWFSLIESLGLLTIMMIVILLVRKTPIVVGGIASISILVGAVYTSTHLFYNYYLMLSPIMMVLGGIVTFAHISFIEFYRQFKLRQLIKKQFETYLDPRQVYLLQKNPELLRLGGERKEMTFLFMDIVGFTPISEYFKNNNDPEGLVDLINLFLDRMSKIILDNGGTIDKYMGDCIMAFWNAPIENKDHANLAIKTSQEMIRESEIINNELSEKDLPSVRVGIGINTGVCIVGNMGSQTRFDYSVIGDAVNLASRLEGQTRNYDGVDLLLSEFTRKECTRGEFLEVDRITVKGKTEKVTIYTTK